VIVEGTIRGEIESLHVKAGDLLIYACAPDYQMTTEEGHGIADYIERWFAGHGVPGVQVLVLAGGTLRKATP